MARIAFLGLGAMGSRMALRLLNADHAVTVWNRSPAACAPLVAAGAQAAATPRSAADGAEFVFSMVRDDEAARHVWLDEVDGAAAALATTALAIECSTLSLDGARSLADALAARGHRLLEAPVSGSLPAVEAGQLVFLPGGEAADLARAAPVLAALGSAAPLLGPVGQGALTKLLINSLLGVQVSLLAEWMAVLKRQGTDVSRLLGAAASTAVWSPVAHRLAASMLAGDFRPQFPVELIAKDFSYALQLGGPAEQPVVAAAQAVFERATRQGLGAQNMSAVAQLYS
ncbi:3-hydroxyisobutyrate dehydrogenase [Sphaerotilus hippei]|uniref:3-hydroxyisobutyrate dehydrogenase n=1 Tax=Sphaerotilus hippei TaxID=744406 RepID=A0A318GYP3_9BURK|nr:NAD(P)-dependent oxidoreductase [Sphaerotilus hippei]PXW95184.1 3-hydroxyisobutyrate dehydrogenase [Sphaerotilus hippei]